MSQYFSTSEFIGHYQYYPGTATGRFAETNYPVACSVCSYACLQSVFTFGRDCYGYTFAVDTTLAGGSYGFGLCQFWAVPLTPLLSKSGVTTDVTYLIEQDFSCASTGTCSSGRRRLTPISPILNDTHNLLPPKPVVVTTRANGIVMVDLRPLAAYLTDHPIDAYNAMRLVVPPPREARLRWEAKAEEHQREVERNATLEAELAANETSRRLQQERHNESDRRLFEQLQDDARQHEDHQKQEEERWHWWNRVETRYEVPGALYPYRTPPGVEMASAAGSMAMAVSLANRSSGGGVPNAHVGHNATLMRVCADDMLNCTFGDRFAFVYEIDIEHLPYDYSMQDDFGTGVWLLAATIQPAVHVVSNELLMCLSEDMCADKCRGCPLDTMPPHGSSVEAIEVVRQVETELAGDERQSRNVVDCIRSSGCLQDVAKAVAMRLGARASLPVAESVDRVASANGVLIETILELYGRNLPGKLFNETLKGTHDAARAHEAALAPLKLAMPAWAEKLRDGELEGRRLKESTASQWDDAPDDPVLMRAARRLMELANAPLRVVQMRTIANATCTALDEHNYTKVLQLKHAAVVQWTMLGADGNSKTDKAGMYCWDCQFDRPLGCRVFFSLLNRRVEMLREKVKFESSPSQEQRRRVLHEHVKRKGKDLCCARFHDTGRVECDPKYCGSAIFNAISKRTGHVGRKLREQNHSLAQKHFTHVGHDIGFDVLHREGHPEERCRLYNRTANDLTDAECMARSMVYHLAKKHGLAPDVVTAKVRESGIKLGEGMQTLTKYMGGLSDKRGHRGKFKGKDKRDHAAERTEASAVAQRLIREAKAKQADMATHGQGRRMQQTDDDDGLNSDPRHPSIRQHLEDVGLINKHRSMHPQSAAHAFHHLRNGTKEVGAALRSIDRKMTLKHTQMEKKIGRRAPRSVALPKTASMTAGVVEAVGRSTPNFVWMTLQSSSGSFARRFGPAFEQLELLRDKHATKYQDTVEANRRRTEEVGRRMEEVKSSVPFTANELYTKLEKAQKRRLAGRDDHVTIELPESHALSWVHDVFDVPAIFQEGKRLVDVEKKRHEMRAAGHPHRIINERHPIGYDRLDHPEYHPTMVGDALRRLGHRMRHGSDPDWHRPAWFQAGGRRLQEETHKGHGRKLSDAFLGGTLAAPFAFFDIIMPIGKRIKASDDGFFEAAIRYLVWGTIGCYFVRPNFDKSDTQAETQPEGKSDRQSDDTEMKILRPSSEKLCFPGTLPYSNPLKPAPASARKPRCGTMDCLGQWLAMVVRLARGVQWRRRAWRSATLPSCSCPSTRLAGRCGSPGSRWKAPLSTSV
jgi:tetrahydromethanopterin S-methyltransferase subunit G